MFSHFIVAFDQHFVINIQLTLLVMQGSTFFCSIRSMMVFTSPKIAALWISSFSSTSPFGYTHTVCTCYMIMFF